MSIPGAWRPSRAGVAVIGACFVAGCAMGAVLNAGSGSLDDSVAAAEVSTSAVPAAAPSATSSPTPSPTPVATASPSALEATALVTASPDSSIDDPDSIWVVVNKRRPLDPIDYEPDDLVTLSGIPGGADQRLRSEAAEAMTRMSQAAQKADASFSVSNAYRSYRLQESLFADYADKYGVESAETFSARGGHSEHQTGLTADVYASWECHIDQCFADEPAGRWLAQHAWEYGYIVRYPQGAQDVTGFVFEPWHLRYVGTRLAAELHESGVETLEQWFSLTAAPDYDD